MELNQLRTLVHVAELGSLSKAADRTRIAQPALSRQIRLLEEELGTRLFVRHGRGMVLTEAGRTVVQRALRILAELDEIRASASEDDTALAGQVAIGMPPTVSDLVSVSLVSALETAYPKAVVRLAAAYTGHLLDWLHRGEIDLAILYDPTTMRSLKSRPLLLEHLFLIGPRDAKSLAFPPVPFRELAHERLVLPSPRHGLRTIVDRCAEEAGIALDVRVEADSYSTLKDLVIEGYGSTILPLASIHADLAAGRLTAAALRDPAPVRRLFLSYPADRSPSRLARFAGDELERIVSKSVAGGIWSAELIPTEAG